MSWSELEAIDDMLPFDDSGRPVGVSSGGKAVGWPALIEKAVCHHHTCMTYHETDATALVHEADGRL